MPISCCRWRSRPYTFALPEGMTVEAGQAVVVQFGARRFYAGIVFGVHDRQPASSRVKPVAGVLYDGTVLLPAAQRALWEWIASYYMCTVGEVMRGASGADETFRPTASRPSPRRSSAPARSSMCGWLRSCTTRRAFTRRASGLNGVRRKQYAALLEIATAGGDERLSTGEVARRLLDADSGVLRASNTRG